MSWYNGNTEFNLNYPSDYTLFYLDTDNSNEDILINWQESVDPDGNDISYYYQVSENPDMSDPIGGLWESETNSILASLQSTYDYLTSINLNESTLYWDVVATDGVFDQVSSN